MRKLILLLLLTSPAFALKTLTSSVAFTDAQGNPIANGYIVFNLSGPANIIAGGEIVPVPPITITLTVNGFVTPGQKIMGNDELQPTGTYYIVKVFNDNNVLVRGPQKWILSGAAPIDLANMVDSSVPDPGLASPVIQNPSQPQTITGQPLILSSSAPFTANGTATFNGTLTLSSALTTGNGGTGQVVNSTFPSTAGAIPTLFGCGTTTTCSNTAQGNTAKLIFGSCPFSSATTCTVASITAFSSSSTYLCTVTEASATGVTLKVANVSASSFTITASGSISDTVNYICAGN